VSRRAAGAREAGGGRIVIVAYRPKPGREDALRELVFGHVPALRSAGLVTDRAPVTMEASDGTLIEVFEWKSGDAIRAAHEHPLVREMWERFGAVCDYVPVGQVNEVGQLFSEFTPVDPPTRASRTLGAASAS
jgi:hypothetical protein